MLKVGVVFTVAFIVLLKFMQELPLVERYNIIGQLIWLRDRAIILAAIVIIAFLVIAVLDIFLVRFQYFKGLRMSKQEIKDEYKQMEGDPQVKGGFVAYKWKQHAAVWFKMLQGGCGYYKPDALCCSDSL
ncbi:flagellar biosynthesis protein FlhB [Campylobacter coli]|nr:flagellar biosynthesis protein FlhB [Campylobacter coli]